MVSWGWRLDTLGSCIATGRKQAPQNNDSNSQKAASGLSSSRAGAGESCVWLSQRAIPAPSQLHSVPACPGMEQPWSHRQGMEELLLLLQSSPEAQPRSCLPWADESAQEREKQNQADGRNGAGT